MTEQSSKSIKIEISSLQHFDLVFFCFSEGKNKNKKTTSESVSALLELTT